jgi:hypothetical protein
VIESYQYQRLQTALMTGDWSAPLLRAVADHAGNEPLQYAPFVNNLTRSSVAAAGKFDAAIAANVPSRFVSDPHFEWTGSGFESDLIDTVRSELGDTAVTQLDAAVAEQLMRFSMVASRWIARGDAFLEEGAQQSHQLEKDGANE